MIEKAESDRDHRRRRNCSYLGDEDPTAPEESAWWADMMAASTAEEALRTFVRGLGPIVARAAGVSEILRAAALTDEELLATFRHHDQMQAAAYRQVVEAVGGKGALSPLAPTSGKQPRRKQGTSWGAMCSASPL